MSFLKRDTQWVLVYVLTIVIVMITMMEHPSLKYDFGGLGLLGQVLLFRLSASIYRSKSVGSSFHMYALMYILYIFSFTCMDLSFYLDDPSHFEGSFNPDKLWKLFIDFVYVNISTISTIGGNITPRSTATRFYFSYKIAIAIFMIVFVVSDIVVKTK
jgi:hypothetical protein